MKTSKAAVLIGREQIELQDLPLPKLGDEDGLLRVEACGLCGTDIGQYKKEFDPDLSPAILGHEVVGTIDSIGPIASRRWGVSPGDRVVVEPILGGCGRCLACRDNRPIGCFDSALPNVPVYSRIPVEEPPGLWGGYAEYMYLHPQAVLHPLTADIPAEIAVLFNPLANGLQWSVLTPNVRPNSTVLILGPGQRGIASVIALRAVAGVGPIIVTGLSRDSHKFDVCLAAGADRVVNVEEQPLQEVVEEVTSGRGVDLIVDTTDGAPTVIGDAIDASKLGGTIVLAGHKNGQLSQVSGDQIVKKNLTILGAQSASSEAFRLAVTLLSKVFSQASSMHTHSFGLDEVDEAISLLAGSSTSEKLASISICIKP